MFCSCYNKVHFIGTTETSMEEVSSLLKDENLVETLIPNTEYAFREVDDEKCVVKFDTDGKPLNIDMMNRLSNKYKDILIVYEYEWKCYVYGTMVSKNGKTINEERDYYEKDDFLELHYPDIYEELEDCWFEYKDALDTYQLYDEETDFWETLKHDHTTNVAKKFLLTNEEPCLRQWLETFKYKRLVEPEMTMKKVVYVNRMTEPVLA